MTTFTFRPLAIGTLAMLMFAGNALSQTASPILNTLEVRQLVARAEPGDHARLSGHFAALAERYAAEAKRHTAMSQSYVGNPNRPTQMGLSMSAHCKRLAELNTQSAATLRELATHHGQLAAGARSTAPRDSGRFEGGAGAPAPSDKELNALAANTRTPADHRALEEYFLTLAKRYTSDANEHAALAQSWRGSTRVPTAATTAAHCDRLAMQLRDAGKEATAAAAMHKDLAGVAR